jgi:alpha-L-rhamnosidase
MSNSSFGCHSAVGNNKTAPSGLQTLNSFALQLGAAGNSSSEMFKAIGNKIAHNAAVTNKMHITTGLVGTRYILPALTAAGYGEVALQLVLQTSAPSWGCKTATRPLPAQFQCL